MDVQQLLIILIVLAIAWFVWQRLVVPNLVGPLVFLAWLVPLVVGILLIVWLLNLIFGGNILHTKIL